MPSPLIPKRDLDFLLFDWLGVGRRHLPAELIDDRETVSAVLSLAEEAARDLFLPHYREADKTEPSLVEGDVRILPAARDALRRYAELGFFGASFPEAAGGMGLSHLTYCAMFALFASANIATGVYPMLTIANARLLARFGTDAQINRFARPQIAGDWFGTMCLSEPQAGSSLGDVRTRAVADGTDALGSRYRLFGSKMWISGGDHDASDNIVHLVLAKVDPATGSSAQGTKGVSLFVVPKWLGDGTRNDVAVAGLNHKMGFRGTSNCLLNLGEREGALGWLIGDEGQGLTQMFVMMNEARIGTGVGAAAIAVRAHRHSLDYARERTQGRAAGSRGGAQVPLIAHADVRRMLLQQKVYAEGALSLCLYCAALVDVEDDPEAGALLGLLTPVAKAWSSEYGVMACDLAIQIHGGYGYTRDFDVEQLWRDNRLNPIHEGTTGIQAIDLVGRKLMSGDGLALAVLARRIAWTVDAAAARPDLLHYGAMLAGAWTRVNATVTSLRGEGRGSALDEATVFLHGFGHVIIAWLWLDQIMAETEDRELLAAKRAACDFMFVYELPQGELKLDLVARRSGLLADPASAAFV